MAARAFALVAVALLQTQATDLKAVLERASAYVERYEPALGMLIAEEEYDQRAPSSMAVGVGRSATGDRLGFTAVTRREYEERQTKSDFLMLRLPSANDQWVGFRVVVEVDGREVRDRMNRLQEVLTGPNESALEQWRALAEESARFNLGNILRSTNVPTFALVILYPEHRDRFEFEQVDDDRVEGRDVWIVEFREARGPTLIADPLRGVDVPTHGRLWIDPTDGRIVRTELKTGSERSDFRSEITVRYRPHDELGVWVPRDMREKYENPDRTLFEGHARYSEYQRYGVSVDEQVPEERPRAAGTASPVR